MLFEYLWHFLHFHLYFRGCICETFYSSAVSLQAVLKVLKKNVEFVFVIAEEKSRGFWRSVLSFRAANLFLDIRPNNCKGPESVCTFYIFFPLSVRLLFFYMFVRASNHIIDPIFNCIMRIITFFCGCPIVIAHTICVSSKFTSN